MNIRFWKNKMHLESMEDWFKQQIQSGVLNLKNTVTLDIGAYHGNFTIQMLMLNQITKAILFEANQTNYKILSTTFADNEKVDIIRCAIGNEDGLVDFYCDNDLATGSILPYDTGNLAKDISKQTVKITKLDTFLDQNPLSNPISLIKIDTQGNDFNVLKGAEKTLDRYRPWLIVEVNFISFYENQGHYSDMLDWLKQHDYTLAAMFNVNYSADSWLSFLDGVFVPKHLLTSYQTPFHPVFSDAQLSRRYDLMKKTSEERLELINQLQATCEERLKLINQLKTTCDERLDLLKNSRSKKIMNILNNFKNFIKRK